MDKRLEVPDELLSLIEKREQGDRRQAQPEATEGDAAQDLPQGVERRHANRRADDPPAD